jgi:hypothetical protein
LVVAEVNVAKLVAGKTVAMFGAAFQNKDEPFW